MRQERSNWCLIQYHPGCCKAPCCTLGGHTGPPFSSKNPPTPSREERSGPTLTPGKGSKPPVTVQVGPQPRLTRQSPLQPPSLGRASQSSSERHPRTSSARLNLIKGSASHPIIGQPGDPESHGPGAERSVKPLPLAHAFYNLRPGCQVDFFSLNSEFHGFCDFKSFP